MHSLKMEQGIVWRYTVQHQEASARTFHSTTTSLMEDNTEKVREVEKQIKEWHIREEEFYSKKSRDIMFI